MDLKSIFPALPLLFVCVHSGGSTLSVSEYLDRFQKQNPRFSAFDSQWESARHRRKAADLSLSPFLSLLGTQLDDQRPQNFGAAFSISRNLVKEYGAELSKMFSSGTSVKLKAMAGETTSTGVLGNTSSEFTQGYGALGISLTQSLWKGAWGQDVRLRQQRDRLFEQVEFLNVDLQRRQSLIEAEDLYWDWSVQNLKLQSQKKSLERSQALHIWVKRRADNGIGDRGDVLGAEAMLRSRQIQVDLAAQAFEYSKKRLAEKLGILAQEAADFQPPTDLNLTRTPERMLGTWKGFDRDYDLGNVSVGAGSLRVYRFDALLAALQKRIRSIGVEEATHSTRPDVALSLGYKTNPVDTSLSSASTRIGTMANPTTNINLSFVWNLDPEIKQSVRGMARADLVNAEKILQQKISESQLAWEDLKNRIRDQNRMVLQLKALFDIQIEKARVERLELQRGTSITSEAILSEENAAAAELTWLENIVALRKLESQVQMFVQAQEEL